MATRSEEERKRTGQQLWRSTVETVSKSVLPSLNEVLNALPQDKSTKSALYNGAVFLFLFLVMGALVAVYFIMEPFIRPLVWALLLGSALHPFKHWLTNVTRDWLSEIKSNQIPVTIASLILPVKSLDWFMESTVRIIKQYLKLLIFIFISLLTTHLLFYYLTITHSIINLLQQSLNLVLSGMVQIQQNTSPLTSSSIVLAFLLSVLLFWNSNQTSRQLLSSISPLVWILSAVQITSILGNVGLLIVAVGSLLTSIGIVSSLFLRDCDEIDSGSDHQPWSKSLKSIVSTIWTWIRNLLPHQSVAFQSPDASFSSDDSFHRQFDSETTSRDTETTSRDTEITSRDTEITSRDTETTSRDMTLDHEPDSVPLTPPKSQTVSTATSPFTSPRPFTGPSPFISQSPFTGPVSASTRKAECGRKGEKVVNSNVLIYSVLWSCLLAYIWTSPHILRLLPFPFAFFVVKKCLIGIYGSETYSILKDKVTGLLEARKEALLPPSVRTIIRYLVLGDNLVVDFLQKSLDSIVSLAVILIVLFAVLLTAFFLALQIYGESIHLLSLISNIINSMVINHPELSQLLPEGLYGTDLFNELVGNAYLYGRKWIKRTVRGLLNVGSSEDRNNLNASMTIERQLLEVWDRSYHLWLSRDNETISPVGSPSTHSLIKPRNVSPGGYNWNIFFAAFRTLDFTVGFHLLKEHIDTVMSILESLWLLFKGNISLLVGSLTAIFSLILSGSSALLNGVLNFVVFSTSLFYLLRASKEQYKPIEWAGRLFPSGGTPVKPGSKSSRSSCSPGINNKFVRAFNEGINSVFAASIKMATFYGLYTWLIHTVFEARLVYMPSVLAAVFGAVPFISSYWASIPAVIELWLVNGSNWKAFFMLVAALGPSYFVDSMIYSEIKGAGHPYLTGLAIAGGVFFLGVEGALFGPILLCCLFVAMNVYTTIMTESAS